MWMHPSGRKSAATDGERWFVVAQILPQTRGHAPRQGERQLSIIAFGDARIASSTGDVVRHTGSRRTEAPNQAHARDNVFGQRKCWAFTPGAKSTHFPETGGACQCDMGKGKGVNVTTHISQTAALSLCSRQCNIKMMSATATVIAIQSRCHGVSPGE